MSVWGGNRGRQNCDGSRAQNADRLLIRPASGHQAGTGLSDRTNHWKDTRKRGHSTIESRTKSTDTNLANAPDGTTPHSQFRNDPERFEGRRSVCLDGGEVGEGHSPLAAPLFDEWAQVVAEAFAFVGCERLFHRLGQRWDVRIAGAVEEAVPAAWFARSALGFEVKFDREEAVLLCESNRSRSSKSSIGSESGGWIVSKMARSFAPRSASGERS